MATTKKHTNAPLHNDNNDVWESLSKRDKKEAKFISHEDLWKKTFPQKKG